MFNLAVKFNKEAIERNIHSEELMEELEQHNDSLVGNLETLALPLEEVTAEQLSSVPTEEYVTNALAANRRYKVEVSSFKVIWDCCPII